MEHNEGFEIIRRVRSAKTAELPAWDNSVQAEPVYPWEQAVRIWRNNMRFILLSAGTLTLGITIFAFLLKDVYQPTARLEIDPLSSGLKTLQEVEDAGPSDYQDYLETQAQILTSDALAISVIRQLHLDRNPEFVGTANPATSPSNQAPDQNKQDSQAARENPFLQEHFDLADRTPQESIALGVLRSRLSVSPVRNSRLIEVSYTSHDPESAQLVTNTLVTQYIDENYRNRYTSTMEASQWLSKQLNDLRQKVKQSNQAAANYQRQYGLVEVDDHDVPLSQLMAEVNHQLSDAQASRIEAEAYVRMINLGQTDVVPAVRDDQVYQGLMTRFADIRVQLAQAQAIYGDENSNVKKLQQESSEMSAQIEAERTRMISRVRTSFAAAQAREQMMIQASEKILARMGNANSRMVTYRALKNEATANSELYNTLQARLKEAGIYAGLGSSNIHIVDLAGRLRQATGPHRELIIGAGAMLSSMLVLIIAFVRESFDNTARTPDDLEMWTGTPSLAILPRIGQHNPESAQPLLQSAQGSSGTSASAASKYFLAGPRTAEAESMHNLCTTLMFSKPDGAPRVILVSSPSASEGKTTVAVNLAKVLAQRGKTCLMEGDLRNPSFANIFNLQLKLGLSQLLAGNGPLNQATQNIPGVPNLSILTAGPAVSNPADLVSSEKMQYLFASLRHDFDYVVVDSPPIIPLSDARILSGLSDAVILVGRHGLTTRRAITRCAQLLIEVRAPLVGVVLNDIDLNSADYHYYNYGYSKSSKADLQYYSAPTFTPAPPNPEPEKKKSAHA